MSEDGIPERDSVQSAHTSDVYPFPVSVLEIEVESRYVRLNVDGELLTARPDQNLKKRLAAVGDAWKQLREVWSDSAQKTSDQLDAVLQAAELNLGQHLRKALFGHKRLEELEAILVARIAMSGEEGGFCRVLVTSDHLWIRDLPWEALVLDVEDRDHLATVNHPQRKWAVLGDMPAAALSVLRPSERPGPFYGRMPRGSCVYVEEVVSSVGRGAEEGDTFLDYHASMRRLFDLVNRSQDAFRFRTVRVENLVAPRASVDVAHLVAHLGEPERYAPSGSGSVVDPGSPTSQIALIDARSLGVDLTAPNLFDLVGTPMGLLVLWVCGQSAVAPETYDLGKEHSRHHSLAERHLDFAPCVLSYEDTLESWAPNVLTLLMYRHLLETGAIDHAVQQTRRSLRLMQARFSLLGLRRIQRTFLRLRARRIQDLDYFSGYVSGVLPSFAKQLRGFLRQDPFPGAGRAQLETRAAAGRAWFDSAADTMLHRFSKTRAQPGGSRWGDIVAATARQSHLESLTSASYASADDVDYFWKVKLVGWSPKSPEAAEYVELPTKDGDKTYGPDQGLFLYDTAVTGKQSYSAMNTDYFQGGDKIIWLRESYLADHSEILKYTPLESKHPTTSGAMNAVVYRWAGPFCRMDPAALQLLLSAEHSQEMKNVLDAYRGFKPDVGVYSLADYLTGAQGEDRNLLLMLAQMVTPNPTPSSAWISRHGDVANWLAERLPAYKEPATRTNFMVFLHSLFTLVSLVEFCHSPGMGRTLAYHQRNYRWFSPVVALIKAARAD